MKVLINDNNVICFHGEITKGLFKEIDPYSPIYKILGDKKIEYAAPTYRLDDLELPQDYEDTKYIYLNGEFKINPSWVRIKIKELKKYLSDTDWVCNKCFEQGLSVKGTYPEIYEKRAQTRIDINRYEELLKTL